MNKVALVLSGGGGKGAYEIGVWKALKEFGIDKKITAIAGTSVGALNAALFLQGDIDIAEEVWRNISNEKILKIDKAEILKKLLIETGVTSSIANAYLISKGKTGVFSRDGLLEIMEKYVDLNTVSQSKVQCFISCCEIPKKVVKYFKINNKSEERIKDILLASSALPVIYDNVIIDGKRYIDGGIVDNTPVKPLYDIGYRTIIVVHLNNDNIVKDTDFPGINMFQIIPKTSQGNFISGTLDFDKEHAEIRMNQGYEDTYKLIRPFYDIGLIKDRIIDINM
ncbi:patatin-like phospholipase family protein [Clostridium bornimense]|uniref:patatin-like phospholipase family protein n=1 Tax=Clostridium bornimense TaxID=1216932 RepID=UPI001C0F9A05|nr:patatin-like phospholipase family protein [Clostridium bornimense]MBU5317460.1 patatin-like phospholipase family protein [Clostridium bornimense]